MGTLWGWHFSCCVANRENDYDGTNEFEANDQIKPLHKDIYVTAYAINS